MSDSIKYGFNTDRFTQELAKQIEKLFRDDPYCEVRVLGTARPHFEEWVKKTYPNIYKEGDYYTQVKKD